MTSDQSPRMRQLDHLARVLDLIAKCDPSHDTTGVATSYEYRNRLIYEALATAVNAGVPAGVQPAGSTCSAGEPGWSIVYIELPGAGQVSWHVPNHPDRWDGHDHAEKYARIARFGAQR